MTLPKLFQIWLPFLLLTSYVRASSAKAISQQIRSQFLEVPYLCDCWPDTSQRHCPAWHSRSLTLLQAQLPHYRFGFWSMEPTISKVVIELQTLWLHYDNVIMDAIASQITSLTIVYSTIYSDADQRKHQSYASLAFVWGIHRGPVNSPHKWPVTRKMFPFDDVIMNSSPPGQNGCHFTDDIFRCIFVNEKICIFIEISLKFVPKGPIHNNPALVQIMAWHLIGGKPLFEPMLTRFTSAYMRHNGEMSEICHNMP